MEHYEANSIAPDVTPQNAASHRWGYSVCLAEFHPKME